MKVNGDRACQATNVRFNIFCVPQMKEKLVQNILRVSKW